MRKGVLQATIATRRNSKKPIVRTIGEDQVEARQTVLLVEDDLALSRLVSGLIEEAGYQPITIGDHAQIASAVERWRPGCVILDGALPAGGGGRSWDDAVAIRRSHPSLPVLMFSADSAAVAEANAGTSKRSRAAGFAGGVAKPFLLEEFLAALRNAMPGGPGTTVPPLAEHDPASAEGITIFPDLTGAFANDAGRTDFVSAAVHELRAPLTVMRGQMQLARRHIAKDPVRVQAALDQALGQVERMARMIDKVIDHSKLASNALTLNVVLFDLVEVAAEAVTRHQHAEPPRIKFTSLDAPKIRVRADRDCVTQILDNLLDNALKYSAPDTTVDVTVRVVGGEALVRVEDHGVGVPEDEQHKLFTPYYRTSRTRSVSGTGLGLHISRQFAERCGGRLMLESSSDLGSVFVLALPLGN